MKTTTKTALLSFLTVSTILLAAACQSASGPPNATWEAPSGREPNASVTGSVSYRERLALTPGAALVVELRDVSYADAPAPLIARQTISGPGQVPIKFEVRYNRQDINPRNTYGLSARIVESDGRLAFTNDTAYDVITRGNPDKVDMLLVLVEPPPRPGRRQRGLAHLGRGPRPHRLGQSDTQRDGKPAADRLLPVHDRRLRPPRQPGIGVGRQRHHRPAYADAAATQPPGRFLAMSRWWSLTP